MPDQPSEWTQSPSGAQADDASVSDGGASAAAAGSAGEIPDRVRNDSQVVQGDVGADREILNQVQDDNSGAGGRSSQSASAAESEKKSLGLMIGLSAGHGIKHFGQGALLLISPHIREAMSLSEVAFGGIATSQSAASGVANAPA